MYLSETMMISDHEIKDSTPRIFWCVVSRPPAKHSRSEYSGLVPMSPYTTPSAPKANLIRYRLPPAWPWPCGAGSAWFGREAVAMGELGAVTGSGIDLADATADRGRACRSSRAARTR